VAKTALPTADTSVYGVLHVDALSNGGYELATSLAGPRAPRQPCRSRRAAIVTTDAPILWGVFLGLAVPTFAECVLQARDGAAGFPR